MKTLEEQTADLAQQKKDLDARNAAITAREAAIKTAGHLDFAEALCVEGKLLPAHKASVIQIMSQLDAANQVADFAAGDANHGKTGADLFRQLLSAQPKQVEFKRISTAAGAETSTADFASPPGSEVSSEQMVLYRAAVDYQASHPGVGIIEAAKAVAK